MTYLFTKPRCQKCEYIKKECNLYGVQIMDTLTIKGLAYLAWFELVATAEKSLPILLITDKTDPAHEKTVRVVTGAINVKKELEGI